MSWAIFSVPSAKRAELDTALQDDLVSRQSRKIRDAGTFGGPADRTYVLLEGSDEALRKAEALLAGVGDRLAGPDAEGLYGRFREEDESASAGMGLFFTEE